MTYLPRHLERSLSEAVLHFAAIGLMGPRQVGKSTLLSHLLKDSHRVLSFDDLGLRSAAKRDPDLFLDSFPGPVILDEIQYVPELLSSVKRKIDQGAAPGTFIITGSQQYSLIKNLQESLAGRILLFELGPMTFAEQDGRGLEPTWLKTWLRSGTLTQDALGVTREPVPTVELLFRGGLPGLLDKPKEFYSLFWTSYVDTFLTRDLPAWFDYQPGANFHQFLGLVAALSGQELVASQIGRDIGISPATALRWLNWLRACFVWNEVQPWSSNLINRLSRHSKGYFFDTGVLANLLRIADPTALLTHPHLGALWETSVVNQLRLSLQASMLPADLWHVRISSGWEVDLLVETSTAIHAIEVKWNSAVDPRRLTGLNRLPGLVTNKPVKRAVVIPQGPFLRLGPDFFQVPMC